MSALLAETGPALADPAPLHLPVPPADLAAISQALAATAALHDAQGSFPHENFRLLHTHGLLGLTAPRELGGRAAGLAESARVVAAVARGCPATALVLVMQLLQLRQLSQPGSRWPAAVRHAVLRSAVQEGALINALRVEPELGTPARGGLPATVARRTAEGWRLDGHKIYSTGITGLRWLLVWVRTDEVPVRTGHLLVPRDTPGITVLPTWDALGLRASASHDVVFSDVLVPADHAVDLREPAQWLARTEHEATHWMAVLLGALYDAVARNARDWVVGFLQERSPSSLGAPLATLQRAQEGVGEIEALLQSNRLQLAHAAQQADAGDSWSPLQSGLLKTTVTRQAIEVVERALKLSGNHGIARANPLERHHRDVLCGRIHTPQEDSACTAAGRAVLLPAG